MLLYSLPAPAIQISIRSLTPQSFAKFGTVIESPINTSAPFPNAKDLPRHAIPANQGTALKFSKLVDLRDYYEALGSPSGVSASPAMSMFLCSPRKLRERRFFDVKLLERHPFTSQTFIPLGLGPVDKEDRAYLVIVAPNLAASSGLVGEGSMPDLNRLQAFIARGDQAVVYARGTWHAPMVVLGGGSVAFTVVQWSNGQGWEDCEECKIEDGVSVVVGDAVSEVVRAKL